MNLETKPHSKNKLKISPQLFAGEFFLLYICQIKIRDMIRLKDLAEYPPNITVEELRKLITAEAAQAKEQEEIEFKELQEKFKCAYLKRVNNEAYFGKELGVYFINEITTKEKTVDWKNIYRANGEKISFTERDASFWKIKETCNSFSKEELENMEVITEQEFQSYFNQYKEIKDNLAKIMKKL